MSETVTDAGVAGGEQQSAPIADAPAPDTSIRETMEAVFDAAQERDDENPGMGHNGGPEMERERAPNGQYAAKPAAAADKIAPPEGWNAPGVDWNRLPRTVQESIVAREQHIQATLTQSDPFRTMAQQYAPVFQQKGVDPSVGFKGLLDTYVQLERQPAHTLSWLAQRYGLAVYDPRNPPQALQQQQQPQEWVDPQVEALRSELATIKSHLTAAQQQQLAQQQMAYARAQQEAATEIETFAKDKPHIAAVYADMAVMLKEGRATDLQDAYDKASWANPQTRAALLEEQRKAQDTERAQKARQAQRAGSINVRTSPGTTPSAPKSIRDSLEATYDAIHAA